MAGIDHIEKDWREEEDPRRKTLEERRTIGFDAVKDRWKTAEASFDDSTPTILGHPVMERWEDDYMRELARIAAREGGRILEVGFGMGISARHIQSQTIDEHWIVEANSDVLAAAATFATWARSRVRLMHGFWE